MGYEAPNLIISATGGIQHGIKSLFTFHSPVGSTCMLKISCLFVFLQDKSWGLYKCFNLSNCIFFCIIIYILYFEAYQCLLIIKEIL